MFAQSARRYFFLPLVIALFGAFLGALIGLPCEVASAASLSQDQATFEYLEFHGGSYGLNWNLPYGGGALASNTGYYLFATASGGLTSSPATAGPQIQWPNLNPLDPELWTPPLAPTRVLKAGQVTLLPPAAPRRVSYVGDKVQIDFLTEDGATTLTSLLYSAFSLVPVSGYLESSPAELQAQIPLQDWVDAGFFGASAKWADGAAYLKRSATRVGDTYYTEDCIQGTGTSLNSAILPLSCRDGAKLEDIFPINLGNLSINGPETDFVTDGVISVVDGTRMWIANAPLPQEQDSTLTYRTFFELGGNVYRGYLEKDGTSILQVQTDGGVVGFQVLLNQAAVGSLRSAMITTAVTVGAKAGTGDIGATIDIFGIGGHGPNGSLAPQDLKTHYDIPANLTGAGQTIAIVDAPGSGDVEDDLNTFSQFYGLPACTTANGCLQRVDLSNGAAVTGIDWIGEIALDTQMVHAIAPGAKIILVTAVSGDGTDLMNAVSTAAGLPGVTAVSMSLIANTADRSTEDPLLAQYQSNGLVFFAAAGDDGDILSSAYPATSPYVTAVGGTRINSVPWTATTATPAGSLEVAWEFTGGGEDATYPMPAWQAPRLSPTLVSLVANHRTFPDVSADADWRHSAISVYYRQGWKMSGGTSASTPIWAGISALFGQYLAGENKSLPTLVKSTPGGFNGLLYQAKVQATFHDITQGSNAVTGATCSFCSAGPGYDAVTGLGTPDVAQLFSQF